MITSADAEVKVHRGAADFPASLRPRGSMSTGAVVPGNPVNRDSNQPLLTPDQPTELSNLL